MLKIPLDNFERESKITNSLYGYLLAFRDETGPLVYDARKVLLHKSPNQTHLIGV